MRNTGSNYPSPNLTPEAFELYVKRWLDATGELADYQSKHLETVVTEDGKYEIDIIVRFTALGGASYITLIECKHWKNPVKRTDVQALLAKIQSIGAHKGIIFATSEYQSGAVKFAKVHGIGLVVVADGRSSWLVKGDERYIGRIVEWEDVPDYVSRIVGWLIEDKQDEIRLVSEMHGQYLKDAIFGRQSR